MFLIVLLPYLLDPAAFDCDVLCYFITRDPSAPLALHSHNHAPVDITVIQQE